MPRPVPAERHGTSPKRQLLESAQVVALTVHRLADHMMREAGVPLEVIQRRLGHASIRTTADIYGSLPEKVDRAAADQLDQLFKASRAEPKRAAQEGPDRAAPPA